MKLARLSTGLAISVAIVVAGCASGGDETEGDGGMLPSGDTDSGADAGSDASASMDSGASPVDSGGLVTDTGAHKDTGTPDSGSPVDSGTVVDSGGPVDSGAHDSSSTGAPTTCAEANNKTGCCASGVAYYCEATTLTSQTCTGGKVCGWNSTSSYYGCVAAPGGSDPSGTNPINCQ
jgi:hypothetical protein